MSQRTTLVSLSGVGTKKNPISRPQLLVATQKGRPAAYLLFRAAGRQDRASVLQCPDLAGKQWTAADLTTTSVGNSEPSYDTERSKKEGVLSLFVQRTGQGAGETLENLPPQPVSVLDWTPGQPGRPAALGVGQGSTGSIKPARAEDYKLVWADEFDKAGPPDPKSWQFDTGFARNHELLWYQPDNARCENGWLTIEARAKNRPNPTCQAGSTDWRTSRPASTATSASLNTRGRQQWQYGRFEQRARIDARAGPWPAFWTLGVAGQWPSNGVDIMGYYKGRILAKVASSIAKPYTAKWHSETRPAASFADAGWASKFHIWRMDWAAQAIRLYVDDKLLNETPLTQTTSQDGTNFNSMQQPTTCCSTWLWAARQAGGELPAASLYSRHEIDYVRVYQR